MSSTGHTWKRGERGWVQTTLTRRQKALKAAAVGACVSEARARAAASRARMVTLKDKAAAIKRVTALRKAMG